MFHFNIAHAICFITKKSWVRTDVCLFCNSKYQKIIALRIMCLTLFSGIGVYYNKKIMNNSNGNCLLRFVMIKKIDVSETADQQLL